MDLSGFEINTAYNGRSAWRRDSRDGLRTMTGNDGSLFKAEAVNRNDHFLDYKRNKTQAISLGPATVNNNSAVIVQGMIVQTKRLATTAFLDFSPLYWRDLTAVISSPLQRARQTAQAVADAAGTVVVADDDLVETDFGDWEGHTWAEIRERWPDELAAWLGNPDVAPPGGESFTATFARVAAARRRLVEAYPAASIVVVAHVTPIKAMLRDALEAPPQALYRIHLDPGSLCAVDWYAADTGVVRLVNDTSHLGADLLTSAP